MKAIRFTAVLLLFLADCARAQETNKGLKDYYRDYFPVGVSVSPQVLKGATGELVLLEFNSVTAENAMKTGPIHPRENEYDWSGADEIVNFAVSHGLKMRGHTLCWHNQTPDWLFKDGEKPVSREKLLARLEEHITSVVTRYKGKIYAWDVVNEAIDDSPEKYLRKSPWLDILGQEYIRKAFEFAHRADPDALLFYNDYNTENPGKREKVYRLIKQLQADGVPIHGIGLQGHWSILEPNETELKNSLEKFSSLGLKVQVTELDVSVYPTENGRRQKRPDESDTFTEEMQRKQQAQYAMFFRLFREYKAVISGITFWNVTDQHSWLDTFPVAGRKNYPLLFDQELKRKKAYWDVVNFKN